jgi:transcriptional regulator with XRE-family HTH domain
METQTSSEALALKKLRELKCWDRKQAAIKLGVSHKTVEKFENGRAKLTPTRITEILQGYAIPVEDFHHLINGRFDSIRERYETIRPKIIENNRLRRSYKRIVTRDVLTLVNLRKINGWSQFEASKKCGYHKCIMGHIENGRIELPMKRLEHIVKCYGFTMAEFNYHKNSEVFVADIQDECIKVIRSLNEQKLKAVFPLLKTFNN